MSAQKGININFTIFLKGIFNGAQGAQGLINYPQGSRWMKNSCKVEFSDLILGPKIEK